MFMPRTSDEQLRILKFWWMLELFSPQTVPKPTRPAVGRVSGQVVEWTSGQPLPWDILSAPKPVGRTKMVWRHTIYLGIYGLDTVYDTLHIVFDDDPDAYDERPAGSSACAGLLVDEYGRLIPDTPVLSSAAWAVGRIRTSGPHDPQWSEGFDSAQRSFVDEIDTFEGSRSGSRDTELSIDDSRTLPLDDSALRSLLRISHKYAGIGEQDRAANSRIIIKSTAVSANRADEGTDTDFLNSFFLDDLKHVRNQVLQERPGTALDAYLTSDRNLAARQRIDVVKTPEEIDINTTVDRLPLGRWPSNPAHSLALSQQYAVNRALRDLAPSAGLMGVNGPPGTGKTTMLRDILAGNVVERARRLASLNHAHDAFTETVHIWKTGGKHPAKVPQLRPEFTGFEMVVASANNAAVENVTIEIPGAKAIDKRWRENADYFRDIADRVLGSDGGKTSTSDPDTGAWGMVAARLGKKSNRSRFRNAFWFDDNDSKHGTSSSARGLGMEKTLRQQIERQDKDHWAKARHRFRQAERAVERLVAERQAAQNRLQRIPALHSRINSINGDINKLRGAIAATESAWKKAHQKRHNAQRILDRVSEDLDRQLALKPGILEVMFTWGRALRTWRGETNSIAQSRDVAQEGLDHASFRVHETQQELTRLAEVERSTWSSLESARNALSDLRAACARDAVRYGEAYPGDDWVGERRELRAPWLDAKLDTARSELFLAALQLHQDFLVAGGYKLLDGLRSAVEVVGGKQPAGLEAEKLQAAWQLFFMAVPMVSTTFASASRMLGTLGKEAIGWLFIDEAGQAAPQYAVGAIWRARRVIAVGDPLQLQPVVTMPAKAQRDIAATFGVSEKWIPPEASVQTLADRVAEQGTFLRQGDTSVWVSAPLRVHRRCDEPMFSICNEIAYGGIMVNGVHRRLSENSNSEEDDKKEKELFDSPNGPLIEPSYWADEPANTPGTHLQQSQIERLKRALEYFQKMGVDPSKVIAISPFRAVADQLAQLKNSYPGLRAGTIHTAQGQEAPVVIFVLGGDPKSSGARAWASSTVNLVNVAVSRAQRRLYVIGDREAWSAHNYFRELSASLR